VHKRASRPSKRRVARFLGFWYTDGEYDILAVAEWASEESLIAFRAAQEVQGFVRITTLKVRTPAEFAEIVEMVP
jgi:uncharacterized protein with GYD domain